jgi:hypothetical protein
VLLTGVLFALAAYNLRSWPQRRGKVSSRVFAALLAADLSVQSRAAKGDLVSRGRWTDYASAAILMPLCNSLSEFVVFPNTSFAQDHVMKSMFLLAAADNLSVAQFDIVSNMFSFVVATMGAAAIFFFLSRSQVAPKYRPALMVSGLSSPSRVITIFVFMRAGMQRTNLRKGPTSPPVRHSTTSIGMPTGSSPFLY